MSSPADPAPTDPSHPAPVLSIVVPAYNEADSLPLLGPRLDAIGAELGIPYEIVIVNDGSCDATEAVLDALATSDPRIVPVNLSRNFGKEAAIFAGLSTARGRCIALLDADLQHPPETLIPMFARWREGIDVVNAVKAKRGEEAGSYRFAANLFNRVMSHLIGTDMANASDFKLLDREVVDVLLAMPERNRFFRGLVAWVGFRVADVEFEVAERSAGETKWSVTGLLRYSINNAVSFSSFPLLVIGYVGFAAALLGGLLLLQTLYNWLSGDAAIGFTTVIALQILVGGILMLSLGVLSIYIGKMYDEQKQRPVFIIKANGARSGPRAW